MELQRKQGVTTAIKACRAMGALKRRAALLSLSSDRARAYARRKRRRWKAGKIDRNTCNRIPRAATVRRQQQAANVSTQGQVPD